VCYFIIVLLVDLRWRTDRFSSKDPGHDRMSRRRPVERTAKLGELPRKPVEDRFPRRRRGR
jgi:hypothetical protein